LGPEAYHRVPVPDPHILHVPHNNIRLILILRGPIAVVERTGTKKKEKDEYMENVPAEGRTRREMQIYTLSRCRFSMVISGFPAYHW
jgi:hypothetical protein